jgi:DnaJ-class molecular chaperone
MLGGMAQSDRQIPEKDRCKTCQGAGWTWWTPEAEEEGRWIVCRECIGTGRIDQNGRKRLKPEESPDGA